MNWILLVIIHCTNSVTSQQIQFETRDLCMAALVHNTEWCTLDTQCLKIKNETLPMSPLKPKGAFGG